MENLDFDKIISEFDDFIKNPDLFLKNYIEKVINKYQKYINLILDIIEQNDCKTTILYGKDYEDEIQLKKELMVKYDFTEDNANDFIEHTKKFPVSFNYKKAEKNNFIFIQNEVEEIQIIFVIFHELCHSLQRIYNPEIFSGLPKEFAVESHNDNYFMWCYRRESQADLFASIAIFAICLYENMEINNIKNNLFLKLGKDKNSILNGYFSFPILQSLQIEKLKEFIHYENIDFFELYKYSIKLIDEKLQLYSENLKNINDVCGIMQNGKLIEDNELLKLLLCQDMNTTRNARRENFQKMDNDLYFLLADLINFSKKGLSKMMEKTMNDFKNLVARSK